MSTLLELRRCRLSSSRFQDSVRLQDTVWINPGARFDSNSVGTVKQQ